MAFQKITQRIAHSSFFLRQETKKEDGANLSKRLVAFQLFIESSNFTITDRQLAHRLASTYIGDSPIEGADILSCTQHWIDIISLWLDGKSEGIFFPIKLESRDLKMLLHFLESYKKTLNRLFSTASEDLRKTAKIILEEIEEELKIYKVSYTPTGYLPGVNNKGHALPFKILDHGKKVECLFLTLGDGLHMHAELDYSEDGFLRSTFQSFPAMIEKTYFFEEKGVSLFAHHAKLLTTSCPPEVNGYSAEDVYLPVYALGTPQNAFGSDPLKRSKKPQLNGTCAAMAITLIVKDFLIDRAYDSRTIQRLFLNEKLCDILFFYKQLQQSATLDDWVLLKNCIQEFAFKTLKSDDKALNVEEAREIHFFLEELLNKILPKIEETRKITLSSSCLNGKKDFSLCKFKIINQSEKPQKVPLNLEAPVKKKESQIFSHEKPVDEKARLFFMAEVAKKLNLEGSPKKACHYVYKEMLKLPIPDLHAKDYWDFVDEIPKILESLVDLVTYGVLPNDGYEESFLIYRNAFILSTAYAIADKLVRRKWPKYFQGFSSPFLPIHFSSKRTSYLNERYSKTDRRCQDHFDFEMLPLSEMNQQWVAIRRYFETLQWYSKYTLFALDTNEIDIGKGVNNLRKYSLSKTLTSVEEHLKFLEQFLEANFPKKDLFSLTLEDQFQELWLNKEDKYLPSEISILYFFAFYNREVFSSASVKIEGRRVPVKIDTSQTLSKNCLATPEAKKSLSRERQESLGCVSYCNHNITRLHTFGRSYTENEIQCLAYSNTSHSFWTPKVYREWLRIFSKSALQITSLIQWMQNHISHLSDLDVQRGIERGLFEPGLLPQKLREEPKVMAVLRNFMEKAISYYKEKPDLNTLLFLTRVGASIESYDLAPSVTLLKEYEKTLRIQLKKCVDHRDRYKVFGHLLYIYRVGKPQTKESWAEFIKAAFFFRYYEFEIEESDWLYVDVENPIENTFKQTKTVFSYEDIRERVFSDLFCDIFPSVRLPEEPCLDQFPVLEKGKYRFNIQTGEVFSAGSQIFYVSNKTKLNITFIGKSDWIVGDGDVFYSKDGLGKIERDKEGILVSRQFPEIKFLGVQGWFYKSRVRATLFLGSLFSAAELFEHWVCDNVVVFLNSSRKEATYVGFLHNNGESYQICKVVAENKVLYLYNFKSDKNLNEWFLRLGSRKEVCLWLNKETERIEEIEFLDLKLTFKAEQYLEKWRYRSVQHPEFFLSENQTLDELGHFKGSLVLENGPKKAILLPHRQLKKKEDNFTSVVTFKGRVSGYLEDRVFFFRLDEISGIFQNSDPRANFFLMLLFAMKREYRQALIYLARASPFDYFSKYFKETLEPFFNLKDNSPEALAFYLRWGLQVLDNSQQLILKGYGVSADSLPGSLQPDFYRWLSRKFEMYLRMRTTSECNRIPGYLRLSLIEEERLLKDIKAILQRDDKASYERVLGIWKTLVEYAPPLEKIISKIALTHPHWPEVFTTRQELIQKGSVSKKIMPSMYALLPLPRMASFNFEMDYVLNNKMPNLEKPKKELEDCVRFSVSEILENFIYLYEKAKNGQAALDIFYMLRSYGINEDPEKSVALVYGALLDYVARNPHEFKSLNFGEDPFQNKAVFKQIIEKMKGFTSKFKDIWSCFRTLQGHTIAFPYQKSATLTLEKPRYFETLSWEFDEKDRTDIKLLGTLIFNHFTQKFLEAHAVPLFNEKPSFAFDSLSKENLSESGKAFVERIKIGYEKLLDPKFGKMAFKVKKGKTLKDCLEEARTLLLERSGRLKEIKETSEILANSYPETAYRLGLKKTSQSLPTITIEGILTEAYKEKDFMVVKRANPSLGPRAIQQLMLGTIQYHQLRIQIFQLENAIKFLEQEKNIQKFGEALFSPNDFMAEEEPELILFQSRTGKSLRPNQAELFAWDFKTTKKELPEKRVFSAPAGEGKTSLYKPVEMKRTNRLGFAAFSVASRPLYLVDRQGLAASCNQAFSFEVAVFELNLETQTHASDFERIYRTLTQNFPKKGFEMVPETFYALRLKYQLALEEENIEAVRWLSLSCNFLKKKGVAIADECRVNFSPFTQAEIGIGKPIPLPTLDRRVFLKIYEALMSETLFLEDGRSVKEVVQLQENGQATFILNEIDKEAVKKVVLNALSKSSLFAGGNSDEILKYWNHLSENFDSRKCRSQEEIRAIRLVGIFFDEFFEDAMKLVGRMKHVPSLKIGENVHVLARAKQATKAYFKEVYVTLIATIQGVLQEGINFKQAIKLFETLEKKHAEEVKGFDKVSAAEKEVQTWGDATFRFHHYTYFQMRKFHELVEKNPKAIFYLLENVILEEVVFCPEILSVTPVDFYNAFRSVTFFAADTGPKEIFSIFEENENIKEDSLFLAHATHRFLTPENQTFLTFPALTSAKDFFLALLKQDPNIFSHLAMICDAGGLLRNITASELTVAFFALVKDKQIPHFDGVILFEDPFDKEEETRLFLWTIDGTMHELDGYDIPGCLESKGFIWANMKVIAIVDPSHRIGTNIELGTHSDLKKKSILLLLAEDLDLSNGAQGGARGRGVLKSEQRLIWGAQENLLKTFVNKESKLSLAEQSTHWMAQNEWETGDKEILLSGYQQIDYHVAKPVWDQMEDALNDPKAQIAIWKKYRKGLVKKVDVDPLNRFSRNKPMKATRQVLFDYAKNHYDSFEYEVPFEKAKNIKENITPIISCIAKKQPEIPVNQSFDILSETQMHMHQVQHVKTEEIAEAHINLTPEKEISDLPTFIEIDKRLFPEAFAQHCESACTLFQSEGLTKGLYYTKNAIMTAKSGKVSLKESFLKAVQYLLIVYTKEQKYAFALSDSEALLFQKKLLNLFPAHPMALVGADGLLVINGIGDKQLSEMDLNSNFVKDVITDVGLARCELWYPERLIQRLENWKDFWPMFQCMKRAQPSLQGTQIQAIEKLVPAHLKIEGQVSKPKLMPGSNVFSFSHLFG